jgi:hypothetical protein
MKFKNYCVVFIGRTEGVIPEIEKISESKPNMLNGKGMFITTFTSFVSIKEISVWFKDNKRSFFVFELNKETADAFIDKESLQEDLFGFLKEMDEVALQDKTDELLDAVEEPKSDDIITETDILDLTQDEKDELLNKFLDNGLENLTDNDKKIIGLLSK